MAQQRACRKCTSGWRLNRVDSLFSNHHWNCHEFFTRYADTVRYSEHSTDKVNLLSGGGGGGRPRQADHAILRDNKNPATFRNPGLRSTRLRWRVLYPQTYPQCTHGKEKWGKMGKNGGKWGKMGKNGGEMGKMGENKETWVVQLVPFPPISSPFPPHFPPFSPIFPHFPPFFLGSFPHFSPFFLRGFHQCAPPTALLPT